MGRVDVDGGALGLLRGEAFLGVLFSVLCST